MAGTARPTVTPQPDPVSLSYTPDPINPPRGASRNRFDFLGTWRTIVFISIVFPALFPTPGQFGAGLVLGPPNPPSGIRLFSSSIQNRPFAVAHGHRVVGSGAPPRGITTASVTTPGGPEVQ